MTGGTWSKLKKTLSFKQPKPPLNRPSASASTSASVSAPGADEQPRRKSTGPVSSSSITSSSTLSRISRSLSNNTSRSSKKTCAICLGSVKPGQGQAIFTAECAHSFHFSCIANSVKHGNYLCPICRSKWKEIPFQLPNLGADANRGGTGRARVSPFHGPGEDLRPIHPRGLLLPSPPRREPQSYSDDEPLAAVADVNPSTSVADRGKVTVKGISEVPAVAAPESVSNFAVLVGVRAPPLLDDARHVERAPIDLVTVLDVSGSMSGSKLSLLKRAVRFVIENLGPCDRLSIVSFSSSAQRILPLRRMTDRGREQAIAAVNSISANGGTNIVEGLKKGARVLQERREQNPVASIILLSDGRDTFNTDTSTRHRSPQNQNSSSPSQVVGYVRLLPDPICPRNRESQNEGQLPSFPVHTFGFGSDHDSSALHAIADVSGGTFSFIESVVMVQDAFARCIGGLLSVVAQELQLAVTSISAGVEIGSIPSGRYGSQVTEQGQKGVINVGDLYAEEEKEFLVFLTVPNLTEGEQESSIDKTPLLAVLCSYKETVSKELVRVEGEHVEIRRPKVLSPADTIVSLEVDRQRNRLWVAEGIAEAQEMAEAGNLQGAQAILTSRRGTLLSSASALAGDSLCNWLDSELTEIRERMATMDMYERTGRAYVLSGLSSHSWQRATTRGDTITTTSFVRGDGTSNSSGPVGYETPSMVTMVSKSQSLAPTNPPARLTPSSNSPTSNI